MTCKQYRTKKTLSSMPRLSKIIAENSRTNAKIQGPRYLMVRLEERKEKTLTKIGNSTTTNLRLNQSLFLEIASTNQVLMHIMLSQAMELKASIANSV